MTITQLHKEISRFQAIIGRAKAVNKTPSVPSGRNLLSIGTKVFVKETNLIGVIANQIDNACYKVVSRDGRFHNVKRNMLTVRKQKNDNRGRKPFRIPRGVHINWEYSDRMIAEMLGISHLTAFKLRRRMGKQPAYMYSFKYQH